VKLLRGEIAAPLFWYLAFTVVVPFVGEHTGSAFLHHTAVVVLVAAALTAVRFALARRARARAVQFPYGGSRHPGRVTVYRE
jgi:hypothetical protein